MQRSQHFPQQSTAHPKTLPVRAMPCFHLLTGDTVGAFVSTAQAFEDHAYISPNSADTSTPSVGNWLHEQIISLDAYCHGVEMHARPLTLPLPDVGLNAIPELLTACTHAVAQTKFCPQEISLEVSSAAIVANPHRAEEFMHTFRRNGFRVSVDARRNWGVSLSPTTWLFIDTLRFDMKHLELDADLNSLLEHASQAGVAIVASNAKWRDADYLKTLGILYGLSPRADA